MRGAQKPDAKVLPKTLAAIFAAVLALSASGCTSADEEPEASPVPHHEYVSRPDLVPPRITLSHGEAWTPEMAESSEYNFLTPRHTSGPPMTGAMIVDAAGEPVWIQPLQDQNLERVYFDFRVQQYQGEPVLTTWLGEEEGAGIVLLDTAYEEVARVNTGGGLQTPVDLHEAAITDDDTMFIPAYVTTEADLSGVGGPEDGYVIDGLIQEIDIETGEVVFEWSSLDHIPVSETKSDFAADQADAEEAEEEDVGTEENPFDYFHTNSIAEDDDGSILVSARNTHAIYRLDRSTGEVDWTLGGSASDFELGDGVEFAWQHDAQRAADGTLTLFDNQAAPAIGESSRGLRLALDEEAMTASVVTEYLPPEDRLAGSRGNAQELANGNLVIGWGAQPYYSEYTNDGRLIYDGWLGGTGTYRAYKSGWQGQPTAPPDVAVQEGQGARVVYVSWNGATEVAQWRLLAGDDAGSATAVSTVDRNSFETAMPAPPEAQYIAVEALDADGGVLATGVTEER